MMPRPKPAEPYVSIVLRLTPGQAEKARSWAKNRGLTVSDMFRDLVDDLVEKPAADPAQDRPLLVARLGDVRKPGEPPLSRPKAAPGSRLKKR